MKFYSKTAAYYYLRTHTTDFRKKLEVVKTRHWSVEDWCWVPCWTVVMK